MAFALETLSTASGLEENWHFAAGLLIAQCFELLILTVLVATIDAQWEGIGDVGLARYEPALLPLCPTIRVLSYSN